MALTFDPTDPTDPHPMTAEQRVEELASILAASFHRLRHGGAVPTPSIPSETFSDSLRNGLDDSPETRLHGQKS